MNETVLRLPLPRRPSVAMALLAAAPLVVAWKCPGALAPFLLTGVLAYLLNPIVNALEKVFLRLPRRLTRLAGIDAVGARHLAVLIFFLWAVVTVALFGFPFLVALATNLFALADAITARSAAEYQQLAQEIVRDIQAHVATVPAAADAIKKFVADPARLNTIGSIAQWIAQFMGRQVQSLAALTVSLFTTGASLAVVPLLLFYTLADWERLASATRSLVPPEYKDWFEDFLDRLDRILGGYIRGQLLICLMFGLAMTTGLGLLGIPYAMLLGLLAGAAEFVPYLGVFVGLLPASAIVLAQWGFTVAAGWKLGGLVLLFFVLHMLDGWVLQPWILSDQVGLHPLAILFALALGQELGGIYGLLLAVPAAAFLKVLSVDLRRLLYDTGEPGPTAGG